MASLTPNIIYRCKHICCFIARTLRGLLKRLLQFPPCRKFSENKEKLWELNFSICHFYADWIWRPLPPIMLSLESGSQGGIFGNFSICRKRNILHAYILQISVQCQIYQVWWICKKKYFQSRQVSLAVLGWFKMIQVPKI